MNGLTAKRMTAKQTLFMLPFILLLCPSCGTGRQIPAETYRELSGKFGLPVTRKDNLHLYTETSKWLGVKHIYGGNTRAGVDCSGLAMQIYSTVYGKKLKRSSADVLKYNCRKVRKKKLREGDLIFFQTGGGKKKTPNHMGIYLKNHRFIHASSSHGVIVSNLDSPYYSRNWVAGGRVK
jgi:lipoprotein Spr